MAPQVGQAWRWASRRIKARMVMRNVAWLQVRGATDRGSPVCGLYCSGSTPEGRALWAARLIIFMASCKSSSEPSFWIR